MTVYTVAVQDYLKKSQIKLLELSEYKCRVGDPILVEANDKTGLIGDEVSIESNNGAFIANNEAMESARHRQVDLHNHRPVSYGSDIFIGVLAIDHAGIQTKITESPRR